MCGLAVSFEDFLHPLLEGGVRCCRICVAIQTWSSRHDSLEVMGKKQTKADDRSSWRLLWGCFEALVDAIGTQGHNYLLHRLRSRSRACSASNNPMIGACIALKAILQNGEAGMHHRTRHFKDALPLRSMQSYGVTKPSHKNPQVYQDSGLCVRDR